MLSDQAEMAPRLLFREDSADYALGHGQQRKGKTRLLVAWMKQKLRRAALGAEHAVARHDAVANQKAVEVLAHGRREGIVFLRLLARTPGTMEDFSVAAKLLIEKLDCPTARHPIVLRWIDWL